MNAERAGAAVLILGAVASVVVMAFHPTHAAMSGHDTEQIAATMRLSGLVHGMALATAPVLTFGFFIFSRHIGFERLLGMLAFFFYAFGAIAVMVAATMSGLVSPRLIMAHMDTATADKAVLAGLGRIVWWFNQSFAALHVALTSVAIALWALVWPGKGVLGVLIRVLGLAVGIGVLAWLLSGTLELDTHGMGAVVVAQGIWILAAATGMWMRAKAS